MDGYLPRSSAAFCLSQQIPTMGRNKAPRRAMPDLERSAPQTLSERDAQPRACGYPQPALLDQGRATAGALVDDVAPHWQEHVTPFDADEWHDESAELARQSQRQRCPSPRRGEA